MRFERRKNRSARLGSTGMELMGALSVASQMALLCPPGFDELVRRELAADAERTLAESTRARPRA